MITQQDQLDLFRLISSSLSDDVECYAFGGTAMMFYGYKEETKDVDLLFKSLPGRDSFIRAITQLGYSQTSPFQIYIPEKLKSKHTPLMFKRDDSRFDLFTGKIFQTLLSPKMKEDLFALHQFKTTHTLTIKVLRTEFIVMLKAVTERDKDFEDIFNIVKKDKNFDWNYFIDEVLWQTEQGDGWVLLDAEKMMKELKQYVFIEEKWFKKLYSMKKK